MSEKFEYLITFQQFVDRLHEGEISLSSFLKKIRNQELAGIKEIDPFRKVYAIQLSFEAPKGLLLEAEKYRDFQSTNNRYLFHPQNTSIPVKAHYHIYPSNSKRELYAVNMDGTAHHKKNRGYQVTRKEADELRRLGVHIPSNNILEMKNAASYLGTGNLITVFLFIEDE